MQADPASFFALLLLTDTRFPARFIEQIALNIGRTEDMPGPQQVDGDPLCRTAVVDDCLAIDGKTMCNVIDDSGRQVYQAAAAFRGKIGLENCL